MTALQKISSKNLDIEITDVFFAFSLFASFSTYFRFDFLPVGLFEISNIVFIFFAVKRNLFEFKSPCVREIICWWGLFLFFSCLTTILLYDIDNRPYLYHDLMAYLYSAILSVFYISYKRPLYKVIIYTLVISFFFLIVAFFIEDFYTANNRFKGFSKNPNQIGLFFSIISYLIMKHFKNSTFNKVEFFIITSCCFLSFYTRSNSQILTYVFIPIFLLCNKYDKSKCSKFLCVLCVLLLLAIGYSIFPGLYFAAKKILTNGMCSELFIRFEIWKIYLSRCMEFPLGFGMGNIILISKDIINHYLNVKLDAMFFDPHNSFISYLYVSGVIPLYVLIKKIVNMLHDFYTKNEMVLFFGFLSILFVLFFHNFTRQPILYFYLVYFIREHYYLKLNKNEQNAEK